MGAGNSLELAKTKTSIMHQLLLIAVLIICLVGLALSLFKVTTEQRTVNIILFIAIILLAASQLNYFN